jgi:hypothetical protein
MRRRGRRLKQLLDGLKERRLYSKLKYDALDHTLWRIRPGRGYGLVVREPAKLMSTKCQHICPESRCVLLENFLFCRKPEMLPFWPAVRFLYSLKPHAVKNRKAGGFEHHGRLQHCSGTEKSSLYTSRLHSATHWTRNVVDHTACLGALRLNIIFLSHELSSDSSVVDLGCPNPSSRVAVATRLHVAAPNNIESTFWNVLCFTIPAVFWIGS